MGCPPVGSGVMRLIGVLYHIAAKKTNWMRKSSEPQRKLRLGALVRAAISGLSLGGVAFGIFKLYNRFGGKNKDPRGFTKNDTGVYGTATMMESKDIHNVSNNVNIIVPAKSLKEIANLLNDTEETVKITVVVNGGRADQSRFEAKYQFPKIKFEKVEVKQQVEVKKPTTKKTKKATKKVSNKKAETAKEKAKKLIKDDIYYQ